MTLPLSPDAQRACLLALGNAADAVGFAVPLAQYSQQQELHVIDAVIHAYERQQHQHSRALRGLVGTDDYTELSFKGGHIGIYVSGRAQQGVPQTIHDWLAKRTR